ncbi:2-hydroxyacid dehydrogenase family protein [Liquorilactobacillus mali]|uniref:Lactate dehydrogenase related enzyme n=1 Tax=Liquorilactobacillus mali KCTC 3596 = DSM 20444 TaxID=1046596 RepID=J0L3K6_9LACO|nr:2-hydroxyacid dehydrogenase family protein [Liquorilactobacillus mali]EJE97720.1 lactate dehydrogenase related enzyme [Liquorilactobacillus mali KCTC 3596 = DSM 20444]KRN05061.1 lactate dehydrogenase related enzyme [Liquorilactobacillus mali KCTC 3596 = DSM 20444]MDC7952790.1 2-hydroxyacid dehydrogenase family protein [Liquorilactobacillus mali]QFQ75425.1 hydroxyacid dehydrogenase [Liquorilactobacillus mali]
MNKVYVSAKLPKVTVEKLRKNGLEVEEYTGDGLISHKELLEKVADIDFLITTLSTEVDQEIIDAAPMLELIANFGAGFNNIDIVYAKSKGIQVTNTPRVSTNSVGEITMGLILALGHRIVEGDRQMRQSGFPGWAPLYFLGHEIAGKKLGIIGLGNIGSEVARKANALGMNVSYYQPHQLSDPEERSLKVTYKLFNELIKTSDYISINAPLTAKNHHQFNATIFEQMKETAMLINVGRGPIVDESALLEALKTGKIAGAALDVYENEPKVNSDFNDLKNVILTPHIGNATVEARNAMANIVATNVILSEHEEKPNFIVNN